MDIPVTRWHAAITKRHARRQYDPGKRISNETLSSLKQACQDFRPLPGARVELITASADKVFKGILGPINKVKGAPAYLAFIGQAGAEMAVGYTGEGLVLEAVSLGLDTCWLSQTFHREVVEASVKLEAGEQVMAISPLGYAIMVEDRNTHKRKPLEQIISGVPATNWPHWVGPALEAARLAPSAYNRQPWNFHIEDNSIVVKAEGDITKKSSLLLDCGIAMMHLELGARQSGGEGKWEMLAPPLVARYTVSR